MNITGQTYGQSLPDQYERISDLFGAHLDVISDIRELYKERVAIDREYASKLQILVKRAAEKKAKLEQSFILGPEPSKAWDKHTFKQSSLNRVYDQIINSTSNIAQDHVNVADAINTQVVDALKVLETKNEETKKKELQFFNKMTADKERTNSDRMKNKTKYDEDCNEVDAYRQKQSRSNDDRHAERAARQSDQLKNDMLNSKNVYLISIAIANQAKAKFYAQDLPALENELREYSTTIPLVFNLAEMLQDQLVRRLTKILSQAQVLQLNNLELLKSRLMDVETHLSEVDPLKDQELFTEYNIRPYSPPKDWKFEPCANFYDNDGISLDPAPKVFLQNKLSKGQSKLAELGPLVASKRREFDQLQVMAADRSVDNFDEVSDNYLEAGHQLILFTTSENILKTEIDIILGVLGDDVGEQQPHAFKSSSFSIPTTCGYCKASIWGLSKQGKTCKGCGLSVHTKCELKVPADCKQGHSHSTLRPASVRASALATPSQAAPTASSFVHADPVTEEDGSYPLARVLFDFGSTSEFELSVSEGSSVRVLEPDDGSGWVKVSDYQGHDGLVPASYLEYKDEDAGAKPGQGSGQYVRAIYMYDARGSDELSLEEGETIELSKGPNGGMEYGDGWWEGINSKGQKGIFPSNYVELA